MGAWSHGAFDNDSAADWAGELDDAEPGDRPGLVQEALLAAVEAEDYLDGDDGSIAIAAAAVVAAVTPGGPPLDHNYGPDAATIEGLALGPELVPLALAALHRVFGEDSEWRELWRSWDSSKRPVGPWRRCSRHSNVCAELDTAFLATRTSSDCSMDTIISRAI